MPQEKKYSKRKGNPALLDAIYREDNTQDGKASKYKCVNCGKQVEDWIHQAEDWIHQDHSYKQVVEDYFPRCLSCSQRYIDENTSKVEEK